MWIFLLIIVVYIIYYGIKEIYEHWLHGIRNRAAEDFFEENKINCKKKREELRKKIPELNLSKHQKKWDGKDIGLVYSIGRPFSLGDCPGCNEGTLIVRKSIYGKFIGCSRYPLCHYKEGGKKLKERKREFKDGVNKEITTKIKEAYL